jgi:hypothetical protein
MHTMLMVLTSCMQSMLILFHQFFQYIGLGREYVDEQKGTCAPGRTHGIAAAMSAMPATVSTQASHGNDDTTGSIDCV